MRKGRRIGVDVGAVRIGIAVSDPDGLLATALTTVTSSENRIADVIAIAREYEAIEVVVGLPRHLNGSEGESAAIAREFAAQIEASGLPVRLMDERLTSITAAQGLRSAGRTVKQQRDVIDQEAARIILQAALDAERASDKPSGMEQA